MLLSQIASMLALFRLRVAVVDANYCFDTGFVAFCAGRVAFCVCAVTPISSHIAQPDWVGGEKCDITPLVV